MPYSTFMAFDPNNMNTNCIIRQAANILTNYRSIAYHKMENYEALLHKEFSNCRQFTEIKDDPQYKTADDLPKDLRKKWRRKFSEYRIN